MASARRTRATARVAVACVAALWLLAGACFVAPRGPAQGGLRGSGHELAVRTPEAQTMSVEEAPQMSWTSVLSFAAAFGMVAAMATSPVRAEEAAAPAEAPAPVDKLAQFKKEAEKEEAMRAAALTKEARLAKDLEQLKKQAIPDEFAAKTAETPKAQGGRKSASKSKIIKKEKSAESSSSSSEVKKIVSPSDELDEDEKSLARSNPVALFLLFTSAPAIYLVFYVLGSLEII